MTPRSALRRYLLVCFLSWLPSGLMMTTMILLMAERGLSLAEIGVAFTVFSVVTVSLELPTGGLADVVGRRVVLAVSAGFTVVSLTLMAVSTTFWMFVLTGVLKGVARALSSGPATAWYVDTLHDLEGRDADLRPGLSRGGAMESAALCLGVLAGGFVPLVVPPAVLLPLAAPPLLGAAAAAVLLAVVLLALPEPSHRRASLGETLRAVPATVLSSLRLATRHAVLRRLMVYAVVTGVALTAVELLTPGRLARLAGTAELGGTAYALVAALGFAGSSVGNAVAPRAARLARGPARGAALGVVLGALSLGALAATAEAGGPAALAAAGAAYVGMYAGLAVTSMLCLEMTHRAVTAAERTTVASTSSLALQAGGAMSNVGLGVLATAAGTGVAWVLTAVLMAASALLFARLPALRPGGVAAAEPEHAASA
ncbi:MFS transporter [Nonomuraea sp. 3-1Str]|uniref:MFS transporter n=1 Tax=Nonomuraea sp. 3-1Str TaxID=2929801 RepID=UPI0028642693|nr:MFS transporter [Nonomuraea sp. 3-1Str]MDR8408904.1 MFS transporter [Nonomuraea sp. 3-1Str]